MNGNQIVDQDSHSKCGAAATSSRDTIAIAIAHVAERSLQMQVVEVTPTIGGLTGGGGGVQIDELRVFRMFVDPIPHGVDHLTERVVLHGVVWSNHGDHPVDVVEHSTDGRAVEVLLAGEVVVDGGWGHARGFGDVGD